MLGLSPARAPDVYNKRSCKLAEAALHPAAAIVQSSKASAEHDLYLGSHCGQTKSGMFIAWSGRPQIGHGSSPARA